MSTQTASTEETLAQMTARLAQEAQAAYQASPFSALSRDYFSRFSRDPQARPEAGEIEIGPGWSIALEPGAQPVTRQVVHDLQDFLGRGMGVQLPIQEIPLSPQGRPDTIVLLESGGGDPDVADSFTLRCSGPTPDSRLVIQGRDVQGTRDGVVRLVNQIGLRQAPLVETRQQVYRPRLAARIGAIPWMGSCRDLVFMGYNTVLLPGATLFELSTSEAIPELAARRNPQALARAQAAAEAAARYGLKTYCWVSTVKKFPKDDPIFTQYPDLRGSLTWKEDGEYILCTEHPLARRWLAESVAGLFRAIPGLWGMGVIIGGEGFYHCFMRPHGAPQGHTTCPRCEALGPATVVANLCNLLAQAARSVNPEAVITAWPYSAEHCWAVDGALPKMIAKLEAGTALLTEIEKEAVIEKPYGLSKLAWDYSIDAIGPCERAKEQIRLCQRRGIPVFLKSEPELAFEASRLADVPCMDRWFARAEALASCGAAGAAVIPAFRNFYATAAAEAGLWSWWAPGHNAERVMARLAERIAGAQAGPLLRQAWRLVSEAIAWSPEIPGYYQGPRYLGPAHPMCADPHAELPAVFYGRYLFHAEITEAEGLKLRPTFWTEVRDGPRLLACYRQMDALLSQAVRLLDKAAGGKPPLVPARCRVAFEAEANQIRWLQHTVRTEVNFYASCGLRERVLALAGQAPLVEQATHAPDENAEGLALLAEWRAVLQDELRNAQRAARVAGADMRLDFYFGADHTFPHLSDMLRAKIRLTRHEIAVFLPALAAKFEAGRTETAGEHPSA